MSEAGLGWDHEHILVGHGSSLTVSVALQKDGHIQAPYVCLISTAAGTHFSIMGGPCFCA